jgi:hypothetical protein
MAAGVFTVGAGWRITSFNRAATTRFRHKGRRCRCWKIDKPALMRTMFDAMATSYFDEAAARWDKEPTRVRFMKAVGEAIVREVAPTRDMTVLDCGCGTGLLGLYHMIVAGMVMHPVANPGRTLRTFHKQEAEPCLPSFMFT